ncbi:hypothetical protein K2X89_02170 [Myxococcota bacterium]|nr:hypothetical protein [Myxococcota bacterium]
MWPIALHVLSVLILVAGMARSAAAELSVLHWGYLDPATEGWTPAVGTAASVTTSSVFSDLGSGLHAWAVVDNSTVPGSTLAYDRVIPPTEIALGQTAGWRLSVRVRVVDVPDELISVAGFGLASTIAATYRDATRDWYLGFASDANGDPILRLPDGTTFTLVGGGSGHHLYELVYDPVSTSADLFVDNVERVSNIVANANPFATGIVRWGALTSLDDGRGHFNLVRFANSPLPLPEASMSAAWIAGIALLAGLGRRSTSR